MENVKDSTKIILQEYKNEQSIKVISLKTGYSWNKIVKTLSSNGIILNEKHDIILELYNKGINVKTIAKLLNLSTRTVKAYLPRTRPIYNENISENAKRIKKTRIKKNKGD